MSEGKRGVFAVHVSDSKTLSDAIDCFLAYQRSRKNRTESTIDTYRSVLGQFLKYAGDIPLDDLTIESIDRYATHLEQFNFAPKTFYNKLAPIRSLVRYLYAKDRLSIRPESVELPTLEDSEANFLTPDEQLRMLAACRDEREKAIFLALVRSGLRVSELINTRTEDLFDRSIVVIKGKGRKNRITFIAEDAEKAIECYHKTLDFEPYWLICGATGGKLSRQYIHKVIKRIALRAGIKKEISPHTMRHTCGTNLLMNGASIQDVQKILGHANIQTTLIYAHFTNDHLKSQYDKATHEMAKKYWHNRIYLLV